jgi:hypothetical protein
MPSQCPRNADPCPFLRISDFARGERGEGVGVAVLAICGCYPSVEQCGVENVSAATKVERGFVLL